MNALMYAWMDAWMGVTGASKLQPQSTTQKHPHKRQTARTAGKVQPQASTNQRSIKQKDPAQHTRTHTKEKQPEQPAKSKHRQAKT